MASDSHWLIKFASSEPAAVRLFCFPHAGGHALAFRHWPHGLPDWVEVVSVQLPGRANRLRERPIASMDDLVAQLMLEFAGDLDLPFVFFGHSMGAILAWSMARALADAGLPLPRHLLVSGRRGPRVAEREPKLSELTDTAFVAAMMKRYGGIPEELTRHADLMELLLPAIRADIEAVEKFEPPPPARLAIPISALGGRDDWMITRDDLAAWADETSREFRLRLYPGGHFYIEEQRGVLLAEMTVLLQDVSPRRGAP